MTKKFFALDHTAEVLENYRRLKENEIFDKILHDERMKKAFLKHEGRKTQNLIADFDSNFKDYKYIESTSSGGEFANASAMEFMQDNYIFNHIKSLN